MSKILEKILGELDEKEAMKHVVWFTENTPKRISGMGDDRKAAEYINKKMTEYGLQTEILEFETYNSLPEYSDIKVLYPETVQIKSLPCCHIASTLPEGLKTELVYVGAGGEDDYTGKDVRGKVVLVEVSYAPATPEKARIAAGKGAIGMICMNWGGDEDVICMRALKTVWGNPTNETFKNIPQIAGLSITRKAGEYLRELCKKNERVEILFKVKSTRQWDKLVQPLAILEGKEEPEKFLLVSGHLDAWEPGVTCNATGDGVMLELARVLAKYKDHLKRSIYFVFWNGHEIAEAAGSTWFADHYWDQLRDHCIGYINIDSPGMKGAVQYAADASRELSDFAEEVIKSILKEDVKVKYLTKIGDQSFFGLGIPSIAGRMSFDEGYVEKTHGAFLGWWNHTVEDTLDKVDINNLKKDLLVNCAYIFEMLNSVMLPYDFAKTCLDIKEKLEMLNKESGGIIEFDSLIEKANILREYIRKLNMCKSAILSEANADEKLILLNTALLKLSRILTSPFYTYCDRYQQDSYGLSILSKPIPLLYPVVSLKQMDPSTLEYKLLYTKLVKDRNRVSDALNEAIECTGMFLEFA